MLVFFVMLSDRGFKTSDWSFLLCLTPTRKLRPCLPWRRLPSALHDCLADLEDILAPHVPCQKAVEQCMRLYTVHGR